MRVKQSQQTGKTVRFALLFFVFIFLIIIGSFIIKGITVVQASLFDGKHRFTVFLQSKNNARHVLLSVSPREETVSILYIDGKKITSSQELSLLLGVPIDAVVSQQGDGLIFLNSTFWDFVYSYKKVKTNMTFLDAVRLFIFAKGVPKHNISEKTYRFLPDVLDQQDTTVLDTLISSFFADSAITDEKRSIHIINASGVLGLGNRVARIISNMGGNVVAVTTGDSMLPVSEIAYSEKESYTLEKLQRLLNVKSVLTNKQAISDIVVILGKDRAMFFTIQL